MKSQAHEIFAKVARFPPEKRGAYLDEACGSNVELRLEVQQLLRDAEDAETQVAVEDEEDAPRGGEDYADAATITNDGLPFGISESVRDVIGPYTLLAPLGEGGMGEVWRAEQHQPIARQVALKVIKAGMETKEILARFEAERQALAMMEHPGIAKVLDAGATPNGRPFFAMELVDGIPLTQFCRKRELGLRERLELFKEVCSAINHAHQKGIIHRDLKPSNVLVTLIENRPVPKVIDFGIAKATDSRLTERTLFTRFEQILGTPAYMSPEQAGMNTQDIDTRSDIYSLGVMLYELLTGRPPFEPKSLLAAGYDEMRRIIREEEPPRPSTRLRATSSGQARLQLTEKSLSGDLDWIVTKAIEKDRSRRYETANALAADIGRYLNNESVEAAAPTTAYRIKKFARRNRTALAVAGTISVVLIAATIFSAWQAIKANAARLQSDEDKNSAIAAQIKEREAREEAEGISSFLVKMFMRAQPGAKKGGRELKVADALDSAVESLKTGLADQPKRRIVLLGTLSQTYHALGLYSDAARLQQEVRDYWVEHAGPEDPETLSEIHNLAVYCEDAGRLDEALKIREQLLPLRMKVNGPEHPDTLRIMTNLAKSYWELDRRDEALELQEEAIPLLERILGPRHPQTLVEQGNLAIYYGFFDRLEEARRIEETTLKLLKEVLGPEHLDTLVVMHNLAATYKRLERWHDALKLQEPVLELRREILGPEHSLTLSSMRNLAIFYDGVGRSEEAIELMEETLALHKKVLGPEHPAIPPVACNLTDIYRAAGRVEDAMKLGKETLELSRRVLGATHIHTLTAMTSLVACHAAAGQAEQALKLQEDLVELCRESRGTSDTFTLEAMGRLGNFYQKAGRNDDSLKLREETFNLLRESLGPEHRETLGAMTNLAGSYWLTGRHSEAVELHEATLEINRRVLKPDDSFTALALQGLAHCYRETGRPEKAAELWAELLEIRRKHLGPEHHDTLQAIVELGNHCELAGLLDKALKLKVEALELSRTVLGPEHPGTANAARVLGFAYDAAGGQTENAIQAWQEAVRINPKWYVVHYWLGKALADRKQLAEALAPLQAAHKMIPPSSPEYRENLGRLRAALLALGREEEAKALLTNQPLPTPASKRPFPAAVAALVTPDSEWRWLHPVDGVDPAESDPDFHSTFFAKAYDDAAWASGKDRDGPNGGFGYDEGFAGVDIGTPQKEQLDQEGKAVRRGAYFRHHFSSTREHRNLELRCQRDDGVIVYLDGVEVARENMEKGEEAYGLSATRAIGGEEETTPVRMPLTMEFLPAGDHILAISLHNTARPSSDLRIGAITLVEAELTETLILSGHWIDLNGGSIRIDQNGAELTASGENEVVTKHWTSAAGRLEGHTIHMTHYINERKTSTGSGRVSSDGSRIDWMNGTSWKRRPE